jgi:hypothetical protein
LLIALVCRHSFIEITFALAATGRLCPIDTQMLGDEIPIDPVFKDQTPLAEGLSRHQQDQYYR